MCKSKNLYKNKEWFAFSNRVKHRDNHQCLKCGRTKPEVVIQTHHEIYKKNCKPWEYALSDCITLCKGCHAREHGIVEPSTGWVLLSIDDLSDLLGICERKGCGHSIRYEHHIYHPEWGYKIVGSTCIEYLTEADKYLSEQVINLLKLTRTFVKDSIWTKGITKNKKEYLVATYKYHQIRIYGTNSNFAIQLAIKNKGVRYYDFGKFINIKSENLSQVKELGYIILKGTLADNQKDKEFLRKFYRSMIEN